MGKGSVSVTDGVYDLTLFVTQRPLKRLAGESLEQWNNRTVQRGAVWKKSIQAVSNILFRSTGGKMKIKKAHFLDRGPEANDDIYLSEKGGPCKYIGNYSRPFEKKVVLTNIGQRFPNLPIHEIAHYLFGVRNEYVYQRNRWERVCTNDPSQGSCFMEWGADCSIELDSNGDPLPENEQPEHIVTQFCFGDATTNSSDTHLARYRPPAVYVESTNPQHASFQGSCWDQMKHRFPNLLAPNEVPSSIPAPVPIEWIDRSNDFQKFAIAFAGGQGLAESGFESELKRATKAWARLVTEDGNHLALFADLQAGGPIRSIGPVDKSNEEDLLQIIDRISFDDSPPSGLLSIRSPEDLIGTGSGAFNHFVLVAPGDYDQEDEEQFVAFQESLQQQGIQLVITTVGEGTFADFTEQLELDNPDWVNQQILPLGENQSSNRFRVLTHWQEQFFRVTPGYELIDHFQGVVPKVADRFRENEPVERQGFEFETRSTGFDFPIWVERNARALKIVLAESQKGELNVTLLAPDGKKVTAETDNVAAATREDGVQWLEVTPAVKELEGRWIVRVDRVPNGRNLEVPFMLLVGSRNDRVRIEPTVTLQADGKIQLACTTNYVDPLDHVETIVEIFDAGIEEFGNGKRVVSVVLEPEEVGVFEGTGKMVGSTGKYVGTLELEFGDYIARFRTLNYGNAVPASNVGADESIEPLESLGPAVPQFSRVERVVFRVK